MNPLLILSLAQRFAPVIGLGALAVYHLTVKSDPLLAIQDIRDAAAELESKLGVPGAVAPESASK